MGDNGKGDKKRKGKMGKEEYMNIYVAARSNKKWKGTFKIPWIENPHSLILPPPPPRLLDLIIATSPKAKMPALVDDESPLSLSLSLGPTSTSTNKSKAATDLVLPVYLFSKKLDTFDLDPWLDRLQITTTDKLLAFLTQQETTALLENRLTIPTADANYVAGKQYFLHLAKGDHATTLHLRNGWKTFFRDTKLYSGDIVHGWGYRRLNQFRLALHIVTDPPIPVATYRFIKP